MKTSLFLLGLVLCACLAAAAQSSPPQPPNTPAASSAPSPVVEPPKIDPEKEASIRRLLDLMGSTTQLRAVMEQGVARMKPLLVEILPPGEYREQLAELVLEKYKARFPTEMLNEAVIPIYDRYFSLEEIRGLIQFYESPLGRKENSVMAQMIPEISKMSADIAQRVNREAMRDVLNEHPELKAALQAAYAASNSTPDGVPGGIPGGVRGGVLGGERGGATDAPPPPAPPGGVRRIRVSAGVQEAKIINKVAPVYPPLARQARIQGTVKLHAIIGTDGTIEQLEVVSGHPLLIRAATDAVKQWRYKPTLLEDQPVMVETYIDVIFGLGEKPPQPQ